MGIGGSESHDPSLYLAVSRGRWFSSVGCYYPLHKVEIAAASDESSQEAPAASRVANMRTDVGFKTFVSVQSRWIVGGVGGDPGATVIFDAKTAEAIPGPKPASAKLCPVVAAVGCRVYALSARAGFTEDSDDLTPWFEVLDLSKAMDLPTAAECLTPHVITVTANVVIGHYILLSVYEPRTSNFQFSFTSDSARRNITKSPMHLTPRQKDGTRSTTGAYLSSAPPLSSAAGRVFLGLSRRNGPISAYRICVSTSSGSDTATMARVSDTDDGALKLSVTVTAFPLKTKADEQVRAGTGHYFASLDGACFHTSLHSLDGSKRCRKYCEKTGEFYSRMLDAKVRTYQIGSESLALLETPDEEKLLAVKPEIVISSQREQTFRISSAHGFYSPPIIAFAASM
ncbi:hypothetical protein SETIT_2G333500v2 [Setaria italica]|uniref:Uncharacterized protein n=1 Tax=Setaria italica TaxID=4555 RepID=A0A368Q5Y8_SETIT|nr:hypothetical protein SETIT_2G333500v2 [Setaria italica]